MSMIRQLWDLWGYQDRVRRLEQRLAELDQGWRISVQKHIEDIRRHRETEAERDKLKADLDKTAAKLDGVVAEHNRALEIWRHHCDGLQRRADEADRLKAELDAAEQLLDEAGESIGVWRRVAFQMIAKLIVDKHCR